MALRRGAARLGQGLRRQGQAFAELEPAVSGQGQALTAACDGGLGLGGVRQASLLAVKQRMKSVTNIQKITKAMKMVAASKMRVAQVNTMKSRGMVVPFVEMLGDQPAVDVEKALVVPVSTDKGLCGGINSTVTKYTRGILAALQGEGKHNELIVIGEKGRAQLARGASVSLIDETIADVGKVRITFSQASAIAEDLLKTEYDALMILFNRFGSAIKFFPTIATVLSPNTLERELEAGGKLDDYEIEGPDRGELLQDLSEFQLATTLYNALLESNCSEQASRMAAMESSTKNATEMLNKLTLTYNRTRQATITTELIEIISGAAALEG